MRIVRHGAGAEVTLTLFRRQAMTDETSIADLEQIGCDPLAPRRLASG